MTLTLEEGEYEIRVRHGMEGTAETGLTVTAAIKTTTGIDLHPRVLVMNLTTGEAEKTKNLATSLTRPRITWSKSESEPATVTDHLANLLDAVWASYYLGEIRETEVSVQRQEAQELVVVMVRRYDEVGVGVINDE